MNIFDWLPALRRLGASRHRRSGAAHYELDYNNHVSNLLRAHPLDEAMSLAVGGQFDLMGEHQLSSLQSCGLADGMCLVDLGCGSGRTAVQIGKHFPNVAYIGVDVVQDLLDYAATICPPGFQFIKSAELKLPVEDAWADMVIAFSVFTHLHHEETYAYLQDSWRALKPGGKVVFSILEFSVAKNWSVFEHTIAGRKSRTLEHMNTFIERSVIEIWSSHLGFSVDTILNNGGQTFCVLRKPMAPISALPLAISK